MENNEINSLYTNIPIYDSKITYYSNDNYQFATNITNADIYQKYIKAIFNGFNKVYNALTAGNCSYTLSGIINGDIIDISNIFIINFIDKNVGINKLVYIDQINLFKDKTK